MSCVARTTLLSLSLQVRCSSSVCVARVFTRVSALLFAFEYSILYTASLTLANVYGYDALKIGLALLSFGFGA